MKSNVIFILTEIQIVAVETMSLNYLRSSKQPRRSPSLNENGEKIVSCCRGKSAKLPIPDSMAQSSHWQADSCSDVRQISCLLWNSKHFF